MNLNWFIGFVEGEGCFDFDRKYLRFRIIQKEESLLRKIQSFLEKKGIESNFYSEKDAWQLRVSGKRNTKKLINLIKNKIESEKKREQFDYWRSRWKEVYGAG